MKYSQPKGTFDIIPAPIKDTEAWKSSSYWNHIETVFKTTASHYGFQEIRTPIFEQTDLFTRSSGDTSDIVSKEMYTFTDKGNRSMSLRPEGTAPIARAFLENHLQQSGTCHNLFYIGPYFRYDRPQAGRFRQFHQLGLEAIGRTDPYQDVEILDFISEFFKRVGLKNYKILINSVGDTSSRESYVKALKDYLSPHIKNLSETSQERLKINPLRILDTKDPKERELLKDSPSILDFLSEESSKHFSTVTELLSSMNIEFSVDDSLVRGLDYYTDTVFEITSTALGAQNSICGGGRYNGLIEQLGGPSLPAIGFSAGIERLLTSLIAENCDLPKSASPDVFIIPLGEKSSAKALAIASSLRRKKLSCIFYAKGKKMQKALQEASQSGATFCLILGDEELEKGVIQLKNMSSRESSDISLEKVADHLLQNINPPSK